jgi:probable HAF family extracellular repeat protein
VVGYGTAGTGTTKGFLYSAGVYTELLPPGWSVSQASGINDSGAVVGYGIDSTGAEKGFLYSAGVYTDIIPPGWGMSQASGINDSGAVVGHGTTGTAGTTMGFIAEPMTTATTTTTSGGTTTTIPSGTTTTTTPGPALCAAEAIYGENSEQTELLRKYRDNVLRKTPAGQEIIKTYGAFSPTITKILEQNPFLKNRAKAYIDSMLPGIRKKVEESNKNP